MSKWTPAPGCSPMLPATAVPTLRDEPETWLAGFHRGDRAVMEHCYREHFDTVARAIGSVLGGVDRESAIHDFFARLIGDEQMRRSFQGGALGGWLWVSARRAARTRPPPQLPPRRQSARASGAADLSSAARGSAQGVSAARARVGPSSPAEAGARNGRGRRRSSRDGRATRAPRLLQCGARNADRRVARARRRRCS